MNNKIRQADKLHTEGNASHINLTCAPKFFPNKGEESSSRKEKDNGSRKNKIYMPNFVYSQVK